MVTFIVALLLLGVGLLSVALRKTYALVPPHELKRRAANGNALAKTLYRAVAYDTSLWVLLWTTLIVTSAASFSLLATSVVTVLAVLIISAMLWLAFSWLPGTRVSNAATRVTVACTPIVVWLLRHSDPLFRRIGAYLGKHYVPRSNGLYEINDLLDLLDLQSRQPDSRITAEEISLIRQVLGFGELKVSDVVRPRKSVKSVSLGDAIGPVLLDELHASGQSSFPVKKTLRSAEIVGTLYLGDLGIHSTGTVEQYATHAVTYVHADDTLAEVLHMFYQTKQQLFIVLDIEEEYLGVVFLEDILRSLLPGAVDLPS